MVTRLTSVELRRFKNTREGKVTLSRWRLGAPLPPSDIVGIYGQNGSGKTSVVQALSIVDALMSGGSVSQVAVDAVAKGSSTAEVVACGAVFDTETLRARWTFSYRVAISEDGGSPAVVSEELKAKDLAAGAPMRRLVAYERDESGKVEGDISPKARWHAILGVRKGLDTDVAVAERICGMEGRSLVFSPELADALRSAGEAWEELKDAGGARNSVSEAMEGTQGPLLSLAVELSCFAHGHMACVSTRRQAESMTDHLHLATHEAGGAFPASGIDIDLSRPAAVDGVTLGALERTVDALNPVLGSLVPGLRLGVERLSPQLLESGEAGTRVEVTSTRGSATVPFRYESEGIKKLVSIMGLLVDVYGDPGSCVAIDELDSGVFEYLLGEILQVLEDHGAGQLVFTAHNLRPLEIVDKGSLVFTTTNPDRRYVTFRGSRDSNNLRDQYLRAINLGGQPEQVYKPTSRFDIDAAFAEAAEVERGGE